MKVLLSEFPYKPGTMKCCKECEGKQKDCVPNPMNCKDFCIWNSEFIKLKIFETA
jgi:hypothetical protein